MELMDKRCRDLNIISQDSRALRKAEVPLKPPEGRVKASQRLVSHVVIKQTSVSSITQLLQSADIVPSRSRTPSHTH